MVLLWIRLQGSLIPVGRVDGPLRFRLICQPLMAAILAIRGRNKRCPRRAATLSPHIVHRRCSAANAADRMEVGGQDFRYRPPHRSGLPIHRAELVLPGPGSWLHLCWQGYPLRARQGARLIPRYSVEENGVESCTQGPGKQSPGDGADQHNHDANKSRERRRMKRSGRSWTGFGSA